ncbi:MAG TPA: LysM peptidoglycan-binding domain-containing protein [Anaerolineales bacterium]|nr:LysM peptidoglycan-binding domain-containing protein [Anaerolineales bacterium]
MIKRIFQWIVVAAILVASFASTGGASASSQCASTIVVQWGDTLSGIAAQCGTTVSAIKYANPGLGFWVYAGQVLYIPTGSSSGYYPPPAAGGTYVVQPGDTLAKIAKRSGTTVSAIMAVNPQITNPNVIYVGQVIYLPAGSYPPPSYPPPPTTPAPGQPCNCPKPAPGHELNTATINYTGGMYIRSQPNGAIIASAMNNDTIYYYRNSLFNDGFGCTWVKVKVYPPTDGYYDGWLLVKDQLGNHFTSPQLGG